jgi:anthranilate/para-aminobenzoate synthase component II
MFVEPWGGAGYFRPFRSIFQRTNDFYEAQLVLLTGGSDISPEFYGEKPGKRTYTNPERDAYNKGLMEESLAKGKRFLGICRGAQLLCAYSGGKLAQHIESHGHGEHRILTNDGREFLESTCHHQMMVPGTIDHELIAWTERLSGTYLNGNNEEILGIEVEPEIIYFPKVKGLGIQGHPEYLPDESEVNDYHRQLVEERLL